MPSPALGSFLREFSGLMLKDEDDKSQRKREDLLTMREGLFRMLDDPALTDAGRARIAAGIKESFGTKGKMKDVDIFNIGETFASIFDAEVPEQRIGEKIPESDYALGGGDFTGDVLSETSPGGAEVTPAYNPYRRSREDMLSEGPNARIDLLKEHGVYDRRSALEVLTGMAQRPEAQPRDPLIKAYSDEGDRARLIPTSQAAGMFAEAPPEPQDTPTPTGKYLADRVRHWTSQGFTEVEAQENAVRDEAEREERSEKMAQITAALKETTLALNQRKLADAEGGGPPIDRAGLASLTIRDAQRQSALLVKDYIEQLQNATGENNLELIEQGNALAADQDAQEKKRMEFFHKILAAHGTTAENLRAIIGGVMDEAAAQQGVGAIGRRLGQ